MSASMYTECLAGGGSNLKMNKTARLLESGIRAELRSCVKVEVAVLGSPSLIVLMVSVDVKQH